MKIRRCINIDEQLWKKLQELAKQENRSASNLLEVMIKNWKKGE
ncbi:MAG: ribbon-helix-helix protein, CopG family [Spirochaetales bacterium]|nr:ribbon-helix-helix protein, CopG family [Spirochaetales bacterium]